MMDCVHFWMKSMKCVIHALSLEGETCWLIYLLDTLDITPNLRGSITVWLTSCLICLVWAALLMLNEQQFYLFGQIQTRSAIQWYVVSVLCNGIFKTWSSEIKICFKLEW